MKAIVVFFDSLNLRALEPYGCDWIQTPNFQRLAEKTVRFNQHHVGSMPCIPARRELHTGRHNFLHRCWGPLEPFDHSLPELLRKKGIYSHLTTDHLHYWSDGGAHYMTRFNSHEMVRGQGEDPIKGVVNPLPLPEGPGQHSHRDEVNRKLLKEDSDFPIHRTFQNGLEFIETNKEADDWLLMIETFDPHEPFIAQERFRERYPHVCGDLRFDWPVYGGVTESDDEVDHCRQEYAASVTTCDHYLGKVLDAMDAHGLWEDTLLIVTTDHGFFLGERGLWSKGQDSWSPEFANIPLFVWDPRCGKSGESRNALTQTIDFAPTLLDYFQVPIPKEMEGAPLAPVVASADASIHEALIWGWYGREIICYDGHHLYVKGTNADNSPLFNYTLQPEHIHMFFSMEKELKDLELHPGFDFTRGCPVLKVPAEGDRISFWGLNSARPVELLFDRSTDPDLHNPIDDADIREAMRSKTAALMQHHQAPEEQFERLELPLPPKP
jgi:arylsulfatase A-like enzyme